jgi:hypothetical protein
MVAHRRRGALLTAVLARNVESAPPDWAARIAAALALPDEHSRYEELLRLHREILRWDGPVADTDPDPREVRRLRQ